MRGPYQKRVFYKGDLAKPVIGESTIDLSKIEGVLDPEIIKYLRERNSRLLNSQFVAVFGKLPLLCEELGVDRSRPGWTRDLALGLTKRHLPERFAGNGVDFASLFTLYKVDPNAPEADLSLAIKLAFEHVPGFATRAPERPKGPFSTVEFVRFALTVTAIQEHLRDTPRGASNRHVAEALLDARRLKKIFSPGWVKEINRILQDAGNSRRGLPGPLSQTALRQYIGEMRSAWGAYSEGRDTPFQTQFVEVVGPFVYRLFAGNGSPGQNRPPI